MFTCFMRQISISILVIMLSGLSSFAVETDLLGTWQDAGQTPMYEFFGGFAPNQGIVLVFKDGQVASASKWSLEGEKLKLGYSSHDFTIENDVLHLGKQTFSRSQEALATETLVSLKDNPIEFVEQLTQSVWINPTASDQSSTFVRGFTPDSGVYSLLVDDSVDEVQAWSLANDVLKISNTVYPNAKILPQHLLLLDPYDNLHLFQRGKTLDALARTSLADDREQFLSLLTQSIWKSGQFKYDNLLYEFRPTFGDLSGSVFVYEETTARYERAESWEFFPETGILKWNFTEFLRGSVLGKYLLLQKKNGDTLQLSRLAEESLETQPHSKSKQIAISERELGQLRELLSRQWMRAPYYYRFSFDPDKPQGLLHEFRSIPFVVAGNSIKIQGQPDFEVLWQWDNKLVFGENRFSLQADAAPVYLRPMDKAEADAVAQEESAAMETMDTQEMALEIELKDGRTVTVPVPVSDFTEIHSLSLQPK